MDSIQYLNTKLMLIENKLDSIQNLNSINDLAVKLNSQADIISNVNNFYESAWLKLIIVISFLGIVLPLVIQYFQRDNLKQVTNFITKEIKETFDRKIIELTESNSKQIEELKNNINTEFDRIKTDYECLSVEVEASLYYLQGKQSYSLKRYNIAIKDYIKSASFWVQSSKPERAKVLLVNISQAIGQIKNKNTFDSIMNTYEINWDSFIRTMKESNIFSLELKRIEDALHKLSTTQSKVEESNS